MFFWLGVAGVFVPGESNISMADSPYCALLCCCAGGASKAQARTTVLHRTLLQDGFIQLRTICREAMLFSSDVWVVTCWLRLQVALARRRLASRCCIT
jgi:hypothetical protein